MSVQEAVALKLITGECSESDVMSYKEDANCTPTPIPPGRAPRTGSRPWPGSPHFQVRGDSCSPGSQRDTPPPLSSLVHKTCVVPQLQAAIKGSLPEEVVQNFPPLGGSRAPVIAL